MQTSNSNLSYDKPMFFFSPKFSQSFLCPFFFSILKQTFPVRFSLICWTFFFLFSSTVHRIAGPDRQSPGHRHGNGRGGGARGSRPGGEGHQPPHRPLQSEAPVRAAGRGQRGRVRASAGSGGHHLRGATRQLAGLTKKNAFELLTDLND